NQAPEVVEGAFDNLGNALPRKRTQIVFGRIEMPKSLSVASVAPLRMKMQRENLTLDEVDCRIGAVLVDFFAFCNLDEGDKARIPLVKQPAQILRWFVHQFG